MDPKPTDIKEQINNLLWVLLPEGTTLGRADEIACDIHHMIEAEWVRAEETRGAGEEGKP